MTYHKKGFTVVELLVAISIIGILSTIVFASFSQAQKKARKAKIVSDLKQMQVALEYYYAVNKAYPISTSYYTSACSGLEPGQSNVIPGLVPNYISVIPRAPGLSPDGVTNCYAYRSPDGTNYAFFAHAISGFSAQDYLSEPALVDPLRDRGGSCSVVDGVEPWAWKVYSPGGACY